MCRKPYRQGIRVYGCGQCLPCRINKRRQWTHRLMLEALQHDANAFVTLTYDDKHVPADGSLDPAHLRNWIKRLRKSVEPLRLRFYAVGEYGTNSQRPHYHALLFGHPACLNGFTQTLRGDGCCSVCRNVKRTWNSGFTYVGQVEPHSVQYTLGYVVKKMTSKGDLRLGGRHPEFARMSLRPGIGADAMDDVASVMMQYKLEEKDEDVPLSLRHGSRQLPLDRYLRARLRDRVGLEKHETLQQKAEVLRLLEASKANPGLSVAGQHLLENKTRMDQIEAKYELRRRGSI